jgi:hypothetical protein
VRPKAWETLSFYVTAFLFAFVLLLVVASFSLKPDARVWPLIVGIPVLIMLAISLAGEFSPKLESAFEVTWEGAAVEEGMEEGEQGGPRKVLVRDIPWKIVVLVFGSLFALGGAIILFGFLVATPIYVMLFLRVYGGASWKGAIALGLGTVASFYGLAYLVRLDMYPGMVFGAALPPF